MKHVLLLCGGRSAEHDISFLSAASILAHLDTNKYLLSAIGIQKDGSLYPPERTRHKLKAEAVVQFPTGRDLLGLLYDSAPDIVFPVLHGPFGEDGTMQGALEILNLPYVGAGVLGSAVSMNKIQTKKILKAAGLPVLPFVSVSNSQWGTPQGILSTIEQTLGYPVFVKPSSLGSSVGIRRSTDGAQLRSDLENAFRYGDLVLAEKAVQARELEVALLGSDPPQVSIAGEIVPAGEYYDYRAKYLDGGSELIVPARLPGQVMDRVQQLASSAFQALQLEGMARIDFLMEHDSDDLWISEANTIPGFTASSMYPKLWEATGLSYQALLDRLISLGLERHRRKQSFSTERDA